MKSAVLLLVSAVATLASAIATATLEKRKPWRDAVVPRTTTTSLEFAETWIRTISETVVEIVHPTVIAGVTFSAKPTSAHGATRWISLNKQGVPKTVNPKVKNGVTQNPSPDYKNWFKTATTIIHDNKDLKAHNLGEDDTFHEVKYIEEDDTYVKLNPIIRCTPDRYFDKGVAKDITSEPFCTPADNSNIDLGKTYFVTWYTRFFEDVQKVRVHLAYIKEKAVQKGMRKRDLSSRYEVVSVGKRDEMLASGTKMAFFSSEWMANRDGYFPLEIKEEWLKGKYNKLAILTLQPDNVDDEDFDLLSQGIIINLRKGAAVFKKSKAQLELEDDGIGESENKYIILMTMPTIVVVAVCLMYFITQLCSKDRDISAIRRAVYKNRFHKNLGKPSINKIFKSKKKNGYDKLPQFQEEHELDEFKQL